MIYIIAKIVLQCLTTKIFKKYLYDQYLSYKNRLNEVSDDSGDYIIDQMEAANLDDSLPEGLSIKNRARFNGWELNTDDESSE